MSATKLLNIFALSTLAILLCSFAPAQTLALSVRSDHQARQLPKHHNIAKKKRATRKCKPKSSSSPVPQPTPEPTSSKDDTPKSNYVDPPKSSDPPKSDSPPTTTSPPATIETKPPTSTPSGPGKLAIAWAMGNDKRIALIAASSRVKMFHLWDAEIPQAVKDTGIPASIMLWGTSQDRIDRFLQFAKPGYASHVFGFNEVNEPSQAYTTVDNAISAWYTYIRPLANQGYTLGSPSTTSAPNGFDWMSEFFQKCGGDCHVDEVAIHWYDVKFEDLQTYVNKWAGLGKPLRITEFACQNFNGGDQPSMDQIWDFTDKAINFLEGDGRVLSYAPFGFMDDMYNVNYNDRLFSSDGLSDLGWRYVNGK
jgi:hypothetical protein